MTAPSNPPSASPVRPRPDKIVVPRKHGQILVEPPFAALREALPFTAICVEATFAGQPLAKLRTAAREHFLTVATDWAHETAAALPPVGALNKSWILTGHQVEFYHAGVWAKVIAADELARRVGKPDGAGAVAFDLLVDHDVIDDRGFDVPTRVGDTWKRTPVHWAPPINIPVDSLPAPSPEQFDHWDAALASHPHAHTDTLAFLLAALRPHGSSSLGHVPWLSRARAKLEQALGLSVHHVPTSLLCSSDTWWTFLHAWIENAEAWTAAYNRHLALYRERQGIKNSHHPMPDLARTAAQGNGGGTLYELPFWIYKKGQPRQRLIIKKSGAAVTYFHDEVEHPFPQDFGFRISDLQIRPRALTLTMYTRLFLADLFIHGIGGALYDQITDGLIEDLFHTAPPYACVSAAWLLPLGQPLESAADLSALKSDRHHLAHNPQLEIDPFTAVKTEVAEKIRDRRELIEKISASLAQSRREWFDQLHAVNAALHAQSPQILRRIDTQLADALRAREQNKVLLWREYYYGLHTMDSLQQLIAKIRDL